MHHQHKKYRTKTELVKDILLSLPDKKGRIMYKSELSFTQLKGYLIELQRLQLMEFNEDDRKYYTTSKGFRYLDLFSRMKEHLDTLD